MSFDVIHDIEKGVAALIDPENGVAMGPILAGGEDAVKLLEAFAGSHETDPATIPHGTLAVRFEEFLHAAEQAGGLDKAPPAAEAPAGDRVATGAGSTEPAGERVPPTSTDAPVGGAVADPGAVSAGTNPQVPPPQPAETEGAPVPAIPRTGQVTCPTCDGFRTVVGLRGAINECTTCGGAGVVAAHEPHGGAGPPAA